MRFLGGFVDEYVGVKRVGLSKTKVHSTGTKRVRKGMKQLEHLKLDESDAKEQEKPSGM